MFEEVATGNVEIVKAKLSFLQKDPSALHVALTSTNAFGKTILHVAVEMGNLAIVQELLTWDIDITKKDNDGKTALEIAQILKHEAIIALLETQGNWLSRCLSNFRFNHVMRLILSSIKITEPGRDRHLVLLVGNTGAGKSTIINYLMGCRYELEYSEAGDGDTYVKLISGKELASIGKSSSVSKTLYPQVITRPGLYHAYCDLAGLVDSRGNEERICAASSTQILSQIGNRIKSILFVLDFPSFSTGKSKLFKDATIVLNRIIKEDIELLKTTVYFVITKAPMDLKGRISLTPDGLIKGYITPILESKEGLFDKQKKGNLSADENVLMKLLITMRDMKHRILIPHIFDDGQSCQQIEEAIFKSKALPVRNFNFIEHDDAQLKFNNFIYYLANEFLQKKIMLDIDLPNLIKEAEIKYENEEAKINQFLKKIDEKKSKKLEPIVNLDLRKQEIETGIRNGLIDLEIKEIIDKHIPNAKELVVQANEIKENYLNNIKKLQLELSLNEKLFCSIYKITKLLQLENKSTNNFLENVKDYYRNNNLLHYADTFFHVQKNFINTPAYNIKSVMRTLKGHYGFITDYSNMPKEDAKKKIHEMWDLGVREFQFYNWFAGYTQPLGKGTSGQQLLYWKAPFSETQVIYLKTIQTYINEIKKLGGRAWAYVPAAITVNAACADRILKVWLNDIKALGFTGIHWDTLRQQAADSEIEAKGVYDFLEHTHLELKKIGLEQTINIIDLVWWNEDIIAKYVAFPFVTVCDHERKNGYYRKLNSLFSRVKLHNGQYNAVIAFFPGEDKTEKEAELFIKEHYQEAIENKVNYLMLGDGNRRVITSNLSNTIAISRTLYDEINWLQFELNLQTNKKLALETYDKQHYISAENEGGHEVHAKYTEIGRWERFTVSFYPDHKISLKTCNNIHYVCAEGGGGGEISAKYAEDHNWQKFKVSFFANNQISLQTVNGQYISAENGGGSKVSADKEHSVTWEKFTCKFF